MPKQREKKRELLALAYANALQLTKMWGGPLGLGLSLRYFGDNPWVSAAELAEGHHHSEDTLRRKLDALENIGRVCTKKQGRAKLYRARAEYAEKTYQLINRLALNANCDERFR